MSTDNQTRIPESAAEAVAEAERIAREAAKRSTETAKASIEVARSYLDQTSEAGEQLYDSWAVESEAAVRAAFDAQAAAIQAGLGMFDLGVKGNREAIQQFSDLVRRSQEAALETWQATFKAVQDTVRTGQTAARAAEKAAAGANGTRPKS